MIQSLNAKRLTGMDGNALDKARELQDRTKRFAIRIINMFRALPKTDEARIIGKQVAYVALAFYPPAVDV